MRQSLRIPLVRSPGGGGLRYVCVNGDAEVMKLRKAIREARGGVRAAPISLLKYQLGVIFKMM